MTFNPSWMTTNKFYHTDKEMVVYSFVLLGDMFLVHKWEKKCCIWHLFIFHVLPICGHKTEVHTEPSHANHSWQASLMSEPECPYWFLWVLRWAWTLILDPQVIWSTVFEVFVLDWVCLVDVLSCLLRHLWDQHHTMQPPHRGFLQNDLLLRRFLLYILLFVLMLSRNIFFWPSEAHCPLPCWE